MRPAPADPRRRPARGRAAERGQALPLMVFILALVLLLATLLVDGSMLLEARRDLEVISSHAASAGAQQLDRKAMAEACTDWLAALPAADRPAAAAACGVRFVRLDTAAARTRARATAAAWLKEAADQHLNLPGSDPADAAGAVSVQATAATAPAPDGKGVVERDSVTVTARRCYRPFLVNVFLGSSGPCPNAVLVEAYTTIRPQGGN